MTVSRPAPPKQTAFAVIYYSSQGDYRDRTITTTPEMSMLRWASLRNYLVKTDITLKKFEFFTVNNLDDLINVGWATVTQVD